VEFSYFIFRGNPLKDNKQACMRHFHTEMPWVSYSEHCFHDQERTLMKEYLDKSDFIENFDEEQMFTIETITP